MLEVMKYLTTVLEELEWENLNLDKWKYLYSVETLLKPFAHQTNVSEKNTSIALAVPVLKELELHL